jgi:glycosyltransferase involved in cell wall biosynthesis
MEKPSERPTVSVIIPTRNSGATLSSCLQSVWKQTYPINEIIVVDDFSKDNTEEIARNLHARIVQQRCNPASARNLGIVQSNGRYVLFQDSDQILSQTVIEGCVRKCENEQAGMVRIPEAFIGKAFWGKCSATWKNCYQRVEQKYRGRANVFVGEPRFFVREYLLQVGMLNSALTWGEDYDLYERLKNAKVKEARCESCIYHLESDTLRSIVVKSLRYAGSMPAFVSETRKHVFSGMFTHAFLTLREVFEDSARSPAMIVGCLVLLSLKAYTMIVTLPFGLRVLVNRR